MTRYSMKWHINPLTVPVNPEESAKQWITILEMVKADLKPGALTDRRVWSDSSAGYAFAETDEDSLQATIMKWLLNVDQVIGNIRKRAAAAAKR